MKKALLFSLTLLTFSTINAQFSPFNYMLEGSDLEPEQIIPIDFDMDGDVDLLVRGSFDCFWFENIAPGEAHVAHSIATIEGAIDFDVVDFDLDGDYDVLISSDEGAVTFTKNLGDGTFEEISILDTYSVTLFEVADFDDDGDADLVGFSDGSIFWFEGDGTGAIIDEHELETGVSGEVDFILADTDNDSDLDIIWCSLVGDGEVYFLENLGGGVFDDRITTDSGMTYPSAVCASDVDGDLDLDIVYGSWTDADGGKIHWNENMGDGTFSGSTLVSDEHDGPTQVVSGDIDLDGDDDLMACSSDDGLVVWFENTGLATYEEASIMASFIENAVDIALIDKDYDGDLDAYALGVSLDRIGWFENEILDPYHVEGQIYYDENENGIMDDTETGLPWATMVSDPGLTVAVTHDDGTYAMYFNSIVDEDYDIFPELTYWEITSEYDSYEVAISDDFVFMDTLDFGMIPSEDVDSIATDLSGGYFVRCNDTIGVWVSVKNLGTTFPSGGMHLELDDSLYFVSSEVLPDSVVGQNIYWSYETLFFFEIETFLVELGTGDETEDSTVTSVLTSTIIEADETIFTVSDDLTQLLLCAYDPNDKTAAPLGEGPEGNIPANTEWIEYTVRFQNTGTDYAEDVIIRDQLDDNLIWTSIQPLYSSHDMVFEYDPSGEVSFIHNDIMLPDSNTNEVESHGFIKYRIKLKPDLTIGSTIENTAYIYFDYNPAVITNTALNTLVEPTDLSISVNEKGMNVSVYPNPADNFTTVSIITDEQIKYSIRLFNTVGQEVYSIEKLTVNQTNINTSQLSKGLYVLVVESVKNGSELYSTKLVVE